MQSISHDELKNSLEGLNDFDCNGPHAEEEISRAENILNVVLPNSFREYLGEWGNIAFGNIEYLGLTNSSDLVNAGFPNFVWFNLRKREQDNIPNELVIFRSLDNELYYCLDTSKKLNDNDCTIVIWNNLDKLVEREVDIGFNRFLISELEEYIDLME